MGAYFTTCRYIFIPFCTVIPAIMFFRVLYIRALQMDKFLYNASQTYCMDN